MTATVTPAAPATRSPTAPVQTSAFWGPSSEEPLRAEVYSLESLEVYARQLARAAVQAEDRRGGGPVLPRFHQNGRLLRDAYHRIAVMAQDKVPLAPDAEWLLDNFYIVQDVLLEVRQDLPRGYLRELPKLAHGPIAGYPRTYALALGLVAHTDSSLSEAHVTRFVQAYQGVAPLTIGELWAVPTMLRLALLENLRRLSVQMLRAWDDRARAERWLQAHLKECGEGEVPALCLPADSVKDPFCMRLLQLLRDHGPRAAACLQQLETDLSERGLRVEEVLRREHQRQAVNQVSVGNCVTSLRLLTALDWNGFFETTSLVEAVLQDDPAGVYPRQDFPTRDRYRRAVERLARRSRYSELDIAEQVVGLARDGVEQAGGEEDAPAGHVGYYLAGPGQRALQARLGYRPRLRERLLEGARAHPHGVYFGGLALCTGLFLALLALLVRTFAAPGPWLWLLALAVALLPASELAVGLVNYLVTLFLPPRVLPKLAFKEGIPEDCATFVVMPCLLIRPESAAVLAEKLEIHYLANPDPQLRFALLTDFADAPTEHRPEDEQYLRAALALIKALNERYAAGGPDRFFLFHRRRLWNPAQGCWMGWERKRGKLAEFNRLLRGARDTSYAVVSGDLAALPHIRFVITLDADTQLPREAARRLVGTLAHPLNRPRFDARQGRVVEGYGVLQPRVSFHMPAASRSLFARIWVGSAGIDPYSTAVSDVYQDLFGTGTFTGKGIYDVDAFEAATGHTFPENHILSHDLIEGNFARCGLVTDIELFDDFPSRYHAYVRREHRWVRGDWQLLPWLGPEVPVHPDHPEKEDAARFRPSEAENELRPLFPAGANGREGDAPCPPARWVPNPLPALERWKVFDNLRRSLVAPALVLLLMLGWTVLPGPAWLWSAAALLVLILPLLLQVFGAAVHAARGLSLTPLLELRTGVPSTAGQVLLVAVFLADQARSVVDAVARTLARLSVMRCNLLEWETAATTERRLGTGFWHACVYTWPSSALAALFGVLVYFTNPDALPAASPFLTAWFLAPLVSFLVSRPWQVAEPVPLSPAERRELRRVARLTWGFFESFVGETDHWLPPDNFQEEPRGQVAHRTSPTNQGLLLLSTLAAHDFGYLGLHTLLDRLENTFVTLEKLERFRGHFYNWYDTQTLRPLQPEYISTVDSGNLLGCLLTLKQGLLARGQEPLIGPSFCEGLADTLGVLTEIARTVKPPPQSGPAQEHKALLGALETFGQRAARAPADLPGWYGLVRELTPQAEELAARAQRLVGQGVEAPGLEVWSQRLAGQVRERLAELLAVAPWLELPDGPVNTRTRSASEGRDAPLAGASGWYAGAHARLAAVPTLAGLEASKESLAEALNKQAAGNGSAPEWGPKAAEALLRSTAGQLLGRCRTLAARAAQLADAMDFRFLYKADRNLFAIGYNHSTGRIDAASYDLLASESCLTSFLAIARGDVPPRHWFQLGRLLTRVRGRLCLISWGGTMFEYLMPPLLLPYYASTLLAESSQAAVARQVEYGRQTGVPWGISESAFSSQYVSLDYQYQSFGVPGLGLKRGLGQDLVIAPYATALAVPVRPRDALLNLRRLATEGALGQYGYYESIDYTRDRLPEGRRSLLVKCFMAHHQGMSLIALANGLLDNPMPRRLHAEPMVRATDLLLQERLPTVVRLIGIQDQELTARVGGQETVTLMSRRLTTPLTPSPRTHLISNGRYSVMVTNSGAGVSTWSGLDVTRWREDATRDCWGQFCYVRDPRDGQVWSAAYQPVCKPPDEYEVIYSADKAEFRRVDGTVETRTEIAVSPENHVEIRRVTLTNHGGRARELELTSYAEVVLAPHGGDLSHPAFGKLFLETEWVPAHHALVCRRRPRSHDQQPLWAVHVLSVEGEPAGAVEFETDRARFLGRGRGPADPAALDPGAKLTGATGSVLDPIFSLRVRVRVPAAGSVSVSFCTGVAETHEAALQLADQYHDPAAVLRVFDLAWAHSQVELRHLELSTESAHLYQKLASPLIYAGSALRAARDVIRANREGVPGLWRYGISGDKPILLLRIRETDELPLMQQMLVAHTYWRLKGLEVDLVILMEEPSSYLDELFQQAQNLIRSSDAHSLVDKPGGVFLRKAVLLSDEDKILLQAAARVVLAGNQGALARQVERTEAAAALPALLNVKDRKKEARQTAEPGARTLPPDLRFNNSYGGFTPDGREYVILPYAEAGSPPAEGRRFWRTERGKVKPRAELRLPPAPWINVIANPSFGFLISESGSGYTWFGNSQLNRLTPWHNDPVTDPAGEVLYLRDDATGEYWTPTPRPLGLGAPTGVYHGQGYTAFAQHSRDLVQELLVFVPVEAPVKVIRLRVRNTGSAARRLSATYYVEWVLGTQRDQAPMRVVTEVDEDSGALLARNPFNADFPTQLGFLDVNLRPRTLTGDRGEFLGRNGSPGAPAALGRVALSGRVGAALDPCGAVQASFELPPGEAQDVVFLLGAAYSPEEARRHLARFRDPGQVQAALDEVKRLWDRVLSAVEVRTPNAALDLEVNRWLLYQALSCRVWGRSALYQSGGAYGFRDQLQDVMALVYGAPGEARAQILRAAARQFLEGDVQHWWHPPAGRGVRTRISDDYLWLPFVVCHYVATTADASVLDEQVPFLTAEPLKPEQEEDYGQPEVSKEKGTIYEHCLRALKHGLRFGPHGLPLMGTGDWNDGMNRVGSEGKGESVWNGWFLLACLGRFGELAATRADTFTVAQCRENAERLKAAMEESAWDGHWYRRAYFDDGTPLGSAENDECRIDSIAQSWAVTSGAGDPSRARAAMREVWARLVRPEAGLILLFTPPFDKGKLEPGYIKGYVPGIRENGGQYTHAATWTVQATALLGEGTRAVGLFDLLNPVNHAATPEQVARYKVEPYVMAADVYGEPPHTGRGGWTWYTGSASWLYRVALEAILGFRLRGDTLTLDPRIARNWPGFEITYRHRSATYRIVVENPGHVEGGVKEVRVDGQVQGDGVVRLADDGGTHEVRVLMGS